jgi:ribosomal protein S18 acetylase RimI-like enzyme
MEIRRAGIYDFMAIASLDRRAWAQNRNAEFIPDGEHVWRLWVEHGLVFCAVASQGNGVRPGMDVRSEGELVGAIVAFPCLSGAFCVHKAFVEAAYRGQRIGTRLFEALLNELDRLGADTFLTVDPINEAGIRLYERWGFVERRFVPGFYRSHEDRYVLTRPGQKAESERP